jgi:cytochrome b
MNPGNPVGALIVMAVLIRMSIFCGRFGVLARVSGIKVGVDE